MINFAKLADTHFWFQIRPLPMSKTFAVVFLVFFALIVVGKVGLKIYSSKMKKEFTKADKKLYDLIQSFLLTMGSIGLLWTFFAYEGIPILSARFWLLVWILSAIVWIYVIVRYYVLEYTDFKQKVAERERLEKYLPKRGNA